MLLLFSSQSMPTVLVSPVSSPAPTVGVVATRTDATDTTTAVMRATKWNARATR